MSKPKKTLFILWLKDIVADNMRFKKGDMTRYNEYTKDYLTKIDRDVYMIGNGKEIAKKKSKMRIVNENDALSDESEKLTETKNKQSKK